MQWWQQAQDVGVRVQAPLVVADADSHPWDERTDLVVVGLGAAGVTAALEALESGVQVFALDRYEGGGSTVVSHGVIYAGGGTHVQQQVGVQDTPQAMFQYLQQHLAGVVSEQVLLDFAQQSAPTLAWLARHGVRFDASRARAVEDGIPDPVSSAPDPAPASAPVHGEAASAGRTGAELPYVRDPIHAPARGHRVAHNPYMGKSWGLGAALYGPLRDAALQAGLEFAAFSEVRQLVQNAQGRVIGVQVVGLQPNVPSAVLAQLRHCAQRASMWQALLPPRLPLSEVTYRMARYYLRQMAKLEAQWQRTRWIRADHGVLLSAGGFVLNPRMVQRYAPEIAQCMPNGTWGDNGSGMVLGLSVGAALERMGYSSMWRFLSPPQVWGAGMVVNAQGQRFVNEVAHSAVLGQAIGAQPQGRAWLVYDGGQRVLQQAQLGQASLGPFVRDMVRLNLWFNVTKANSVAALARKLGLPAQALEDTVAQYNRAADGQSVDPLGKPQAYFKPVCTGPFYAMDIGMHSKWMPMPALPHGGLRVNDLTGQVLDAQGQPIAGLYAAGRCAAGTVAAAGVGGMALADSLYSGRRAGRAVAQALRGARAASSASTPAPGPRSPSVLAP